MSQLAMLLNPPPPPEDEVECSQCFEYKPESEFYKRKNGKLFRYCKECQKAMNREQRKKKVKES